MNRTSSAELNIFIVPRCLTPGQQQVSDAWGQTGRSCSRVGAVTRVLCSDSPPWMWWYHWFCWTLSASGVVCILVAHEHYSIDVVVAYFVSTRTFWWYHTMANSHVSPAAGAGPVLEVRSLTESLCRTCVRLPTTSCPGPGGTPSSTSWRGTSRRRSPSCSCRRWACSRPADRSTGWWRGAGTREDLQDPTVLFLISDRSSSCLRVQVRGSGAGRWTLSVFRAT